MVNLTAMQRRDDANPSSGDMPSGVLRQRRNFIIACFVLVFAAYAGLNIKFSEFEVFGVKVFLERAISVKWNRVLWLVWFYFLVRYAQYLAFYNVSAELKGAYVESLMRMYEEKLTPIVKSRLPERVHNAGAAYVSIESVTHTWSDTHYHTYMSDSSGRVEYSVRLLYLYVAYLKVRAVLNVIMYSRYFSDYYLPYVIAAVPIVQAMYLGKI